VYIQAPQSTSSAIFAVVEEPENDETTDNSSEGGEEENFLTYEENVAPVLVSAAIEVERRDENVKTLIIVIDDAGNNLRELEAFLHFPAPLTIAVLPALAHSVESARRIRGAGKELILHQPMEAIGGQNPGPGAVYSGMSSEEIKSIIERNIYEIGPIAGMNNHQGSRITMDEVAMESVLKLTMAHNIYFLDSRTTADTVVQRVARRLGVKVEERNTFIDNDQTKRAMLYQINAGLKTADTKGFSIMIGHTWSPELASLLMEIYPELIERGYTFTTVSRLQTMSKEEGGGQ
jgi:polysaccharide deacetylase 2 family uncharacterized protein YibQ